MNTDGRSDTENPPADAPAVWQLRIYIVGGARNSVLALARLQAILDTHVPGQYSLDVVDILNYPQRALTDGILLTPTLIKLAPLPTVRLVGNLSDRERVIWALELPPEPAEVDGRAGVT